MTVSPADRCLLSAPRPAGEQSRERAAPPGYQNTGGRFRLGEGRKDYNRQYFEVYQARLAAMRPRIVAEAKRRFGENIQVPPPPGRGSNSIPNNS
jgi:hypothetical protein